MTTALSAFVCGEELWPVKRLELDADIARVISQEITSVMNDK